MKTLFYIIFFIYMSSLQANTILIGVLAKRGDDITLQRWSPTALYLSEKIPEHDFKIVALDFSEIFLVVENKEIDFVLANSSIYVEMEVSFAISRIATLLNHPESLCRACFGGVIFTQKNNNKINKLKDIKYLAAVENTSLGGYLVAAREFKKQKAKIKKVTFLHTHDAVVMAVLQGEFPAGTVRTDTLEHMAAEGKIKLEDFKIINQQSGDFPYLISTESYPEWPIAKLAHTDKDLARLVAIALMQMDEETAKLSHYYGWTVPRNYQPIHNLQKELQVGAYKNNYKLAFYLLFQKYWYLFVIIIAVFIILILIIDKFFQFNKKLKLSENLLKKAYDNLEDKVKQRTQELKQKEQELEIIIDHIPLMLYVKDASSMEFIYFNQAGEKLLGTNKQNVIGYKNEQVFTKQDALFINQKEQEALNHNKKDIPEQTIDTKNGICLLHTIMTAIKDNNEQVKYIVNISEDITERKKNEAIITRINRANRILSDINQSLIRSENEQNLLTIICNTIIKEGGYCNAWIGFIEETETTITINPAEIKGAYSDFLQHINLTWDKEQDYQSNPTLSAIKTKKPFIIQDIVSSENHVWKQPIMHTCFSSVVSLPLQLQKQVFGILEIYACKVYAFHREEMNLLQELANDVAYAITALRNRKRKEALEDQLVLFSQLVNYSNDAVLVIKADTAEIIYVNQKACDYLMYDEKELLNMTAMDINLQAKTLQAWQSIRHQIKQGIIFETQHITKQKTVIPVEASAKIITLENTEYLIAFIRNITERKKIEYNLIQEKEKFRFLFEQSQLATALVDLDFYFIQINQSFEKMVGYSEAELQTMTIIEVTHIEDRAFNYQIQKALEKGEIPNFELEKRFIHKNGKIIKGLLKATLIHDNDNKPLYYLGQILIIH